MTQEGDAGIGRTAVRRGGGAVRCSHRRNPAPMPTSKRTGAANHPHPTLSLKGEGTGRSKQRPYGHQRYAGRFVRSANSIPWAGTIPAPRGVVGISRAGLRPKRLWTVVRPGVVAAPTGVSTEANKGKEERYGDDGQSQEAFAGESQANRRYLAFAKKADDEGKKQVAKLSTRRPKRRPSTQTRT